LVLVLLALVIKVAILAMVILWLVVEVVVIQEEQRLALQLVLQQMEL
jgi:hypothetical protein